MLMLAESRPQPNVTDNQTVEVVKRSELHSAAETMGGGAVFRLAGKVPPALEEL